MTWNIGPLSYFTTPSWPTTSSDSLKEVDKSGSGSSSASGSKSTVHHSKTAIIVAAVIAAIAGLIFLTALVCVIRCCFRRRRRNQANRDPAASSGLLNRGWQKVDGEEKLGDEDFGNQSYNARDKLLNPDVPVYNARGMAYEPFRPVAEKPE